MKKALLLLALLCLLIGTTSARAQQAAPIDNLRVEIWPDYDQNAILVLLTGTVATVPANITIPIPESATLNAVARVTTDNNMVADVDTDSTIAGQITFPLTENRFRVEYYDAYETTADGQIAYTFNWTAPVSVTAVETIIQKPAAATAMITDPATVNVVPNTNDGLDYHVMPAQSVPALQPYAVTVIYDNPTGALTANRSAPNAAPATTNAQPETGGSNFRWEFIMAGLGVIALVAVVIWQLLAQRQPRRSARKPRSRRAVSRTKRKPTQAKRTKSAAAARFCHECGTSLTVGDKFCRECGTAVKR